MKHIQKFTEAKKHQGLEDIMEDAFYKFINDAKELGEIAHSEEGHGAGVSDRESAFEAIREYSELLNKLNSSFERFKTKANEFYIDSNTGE